MIRKMAEADLDRVALIEKSTFSEPWSRDGFAEILDRSDVIFLVALCGSEIAGYIGAYVAIDEAEITNVCVAEDYRRRHLGDELVNALIVEAELRGVNRIVLEVRVSNKGAIALYEKYDFKNIGVRKNFYRAPVEDAYIMERI